MIEEIDEMNEKTRKFVNVMYKILGVAPIIAAAVFTILFMFVLKDRTEERILHSATTFLLWMFATVFYIMIDAFFKNKKKMLFSVIGMCISVALAIVVTPLDRYVKLCFIRSHVAAYIAVVVLAAVYIFVVRWRKHFES
jgi:hypothetical protein